MALNLIVTWICESDYTTWTEGDKIEVFYNDTTEAYQVDENDVTVTSGDDISFKNFLPSPTGYKFCDGANLISFNPSLSFPYVSRVSKFSETCSINVCDLVKTGAPITTEATNSTTADGTITVYASSSNTIKYDVTDFNYSTEGQTSNTITGLLPGSYTVYAKDSIGCAITWQVTVPVDDNYGILQYWQFYDKEGTQHQIELYQRDYSGSSTLRDLLEGTPVNRAMRAENTNRLVNIIPSSLTFFPISETDREYLSLIRDSDERKYQVRYKYDPGGGMTEIFRGFVLTELYEEPYTANDYPVSLQCTDGLADLKNYDFTDESGSQVYGDITVLEVIRLCMAKTGLGLGFRVGMNIYEASMASPAGANGGTGAGDATNDPLNQLYVDSDTYYQSGNTLNCYEVLADVLRSTFCHIYQYGGYWYIVHKTEMGASFNYREYDSTGTYTTNGSISPVLDFKEANVSSHVTLTNATLQGIEVYKDVNMNKNRQLVNSVLAEFNERNLNGDGYIGWSTVLNGDSGSFEAVQRGKKLITVPVIFEGRTRNGFPVQQLQNTLQSKEIDQYLFKANFPDNQGGNAYMEATGTVEYRSADTYRLNLPILFALIAGYGNQLPLVRVKIKFKVGTYYLQQDGSWSTTESFFNFNLEIFNELQTFSLTGNFRDGVTTNTTETYSIKVYDVDPYEYDDEQASAALLNSNLPSASSYNVNDIWIGRLTDEVNYFYWANRIDNTGNQEWVQFANGVNYSPSNIVVTQNSYSAAFYGSILLTTQPNGDSLDELETYSYSSSDRNVQDLEYELRHFDLNTTLNNTENLVENYFKLSNGNPTGDWGSTNVELYRIIGNYVAAWYNKMNYNLRGEITTDLHLTPYNVFRATADDNRIYFPNYFSIDDRRMKGTLELLEITNDTTPPANAREHSSAYSSAYS